MQAASQAYFGLDVSDLGLSEAALLAGLIRNPRSAEPYNHPEEAKRRRRTVLDAMLEEKEFFIRKAIGWALREYSKVDPDGVERYCATHELSPLSRREALRKLDRIRSP